MNLLSKFEPLSISSYFLVRSDWFFFCRDKTPGRIVRSAFLIAYGPWFELNIIYNFINFQFQGGINKSFCKIIMLFLESVGLSRAKSLALPGLPSNKLFFNFKLPYDQTKYIRRTKLSMRINNLLKASHVDLRRL